MWYSIHLAHATYFNSQIAYVTQVLILLVIIGILIYLICKKKAKKIITFIVGALLIIGSLFNGFTVHHNQLRASNYIYQSERHVSQIELSHHIHRFSNIKADLKQNKKLPHYLKPTKFHLVKWYQYL